MRKAFLLVFPLLLVGIAAFSQDITRQDADSLTKALQQVKPDPDRIDALLKLAQFHIFKPGEFKTDLDSAAGLMREARELNDNLKSDEATGHILLVESYMANEHQERAKGKQLLGDALRLLDKGNNHYLKGRAYMSMADYYDLNSAAEIPDRMRAFKQAIAAFKAGGYIEREAYAYKMLAETDSSDVTAEEELRKSLALYQSINYPAVQGVCDLMAVVFIIRSNFPEALKWGLKALKTAEAVGDSSMQLCTINNHIAIIYFHSRDSVNAVKHYTEGLRIAEKHNDKGNVYVLTHNIAAIYFNLKQPLRARDLMERIQKKYGPPDKKPAMTYHWYVSDRLKLHTALKQFGLAEPYSRELLAMEHQFPDHIQSDAYAMLLEYFLASGQYSRMLPYLKKDEVVAKSYGNPRNMANLHLLWFSYDTARHDYQSAVTHLLENNKWVNTIYTNARDRMLKELTVQFGTEKKADSIALLNKESLLEKANTRQATLEKNMTIAGIIAVVIIALLLFRQNRVKQRNNNVITQQNEQLQHFLTEKEWLLKEIHHRVKNNLQIVMSLLNSQSEYIDNGPALTAIHDSQHRVHAMSLIHQKLYNTENVSSINISLYIRELTSYLADSFNTGQRIRIVYEIEPIELDVSQAVPLGLILNEAITNAIKYAFPDDRSGIISISFTSTAAGHYLLRIADNGVGMPPPFTNKKNGSLGMSLMEGLSGDLEGTFTIENNNGTTIAVSFVHKPGIHRMNVVPASYVSNN